MCVTGGQRTKTMFTWCAQARGHMWGWACVWGGADSLQKRAHPAKRLHLFHVQQTLPLRAESKGPPGTAAVATGPRDPECGRQGANTYFQQQQHLVHSSVAASTEALHSPQSSPSHLLCIALAPVRASPSLCEYNNSKLQQAYSLSQLITISGK